MQFDEYHAYIDWLQASYAADIAIVICAQDGVNEDGSAPALSSPIPAPTVYQQVYVEEREQGSNVFYWNEFYTSIWQEYDAVSAHPSKASHAVYAAALKSFLEQEVLPVIDR